MAQEVILRDKQDTTTRLIKHETWALSLLPVEVSAWPGVLCLLQSELDHQYPEQRGQGHSLHTPVCPGLTATNLRTREGKAGTLSLRQAQQQSKV